MVHDDLLLLVHGRDMFSQPEMADERNYYKPKAGRHDDHATPQTRNWSAGMAVFDISEPAEPRRDRLHAGRGHRAAPHLVRRRPLGLCLGHDGGFSDYILVTIDMADPTKPAIVGRYWLPGMNLAAGEVANGRSPPAATACTTRWSRTTWPIAPGAMPVSWWSTSRTRAILSSSCTKTGRRRLAAARATACRCPTATSSIVLDEAVLDEKQDGFKPIWVFDNQVKSNPVSVATFPEPCDRDYIAVGGHSARTTSTKTGRGRSSARS